MKLRAIKYFCMFAALAAFGTGFGAGTITAAEETALLPNEDVQVLASGPIHEAFAEAVAFDPETGIIAPKAPPALIEEIPPEQKPEGDVQWISGYWAWDDERNEYLWVSGIWRVPPPGRRWVPGYWNRISNGFQWISGYWASMKTAGIEYLPEPPESVEVGPSSNAPSTDYIWIPGCWIWNYGRYAWRPGYWAVAHSDWIWVPEHYIWTPRGHIFVSGYWDHKVIHRGVLFAPVFFPRAHLGLTISFSPGFVIDLNIFDEALFLRIGYCHYYYGDYYSPKYYRRGIYPLFSLHARRVIYDPIYAHQRWNHRNDREWEKRLQTKFRERRENENLRPLRSFDQRSGSYNASRTSGRVRPNSVIPLDRAVKNKSSAYRFQPLSERERRDFTQKQKVVSSDQKERQSLDPQRQKVVSSRQKERQTLEPQKQKVVSSRQKERQTLELQRQKVVSSHQKERQSLELQKRKIMEEKASRKPEPNKEKFSRSPVMGRSNEKADLKKAPPARYITPKPDPNVEPQQRKYGISRSWENSKKSEDEEESRSKVRVQRSMYKDQKSGNRGGQSEDRMQKSNERQQKQDDERQKWRKR